ncbi:MAG TPA: BamA/TamA family outer membrane protein [Usitatibacter sp.]|nr:BamA/TamA family outer membrane protein [Usitatibacter sp.]
MRCRRSSSAALLAAWTLAGTAHALSLPDRFVDPEDGNLDASQYLLDHRGALPVPIIITEPAVGYGGGLALAWFSESIREAAEAAKGGRITPPNIYAGAAFGTENGTKGAFAGARMAFDEDRWRYRAAALATSVNLDFYGIGGDLAQGLSKVGYNLKGAGVFQELTRRIGESDHFVGLRYLYLDIATRLSVDAQDANLTPRELGSRSSELGARWVYDSRDNIFTTTRGIEAAVDAMFSDPAIGSDNTFRTYRAHAFAYGKPAESFVLAGRVDGRTARGDVPFYQLPFIDMRGIPAARYQDESTGVIEVEGRYYATPRWIVVGFAGAGRAWGRDTSFGDAGTKTTRGVGIRYMLARRLGLAVGIDVARGPEKTAFYLQVGNAWR